MVSLGVFSMGDGIKMVVKTWNLMLLHHGDQSDETKKHVGVLQWNMGINFHGGLPWRKDEKSVTKIVFAMVQWNPGI